MGKFCVNCGKAIGDNEVCECQNGSVTGQVPPVQPMQSQVPPVQPMQSQVPPVQSQVPPVQSIQSQIPPVQEQVQQPAQRTKEAEWVNEKKDKVIFEAKNIFAEMVPLLKQPVSTTRAIAQRKAVTIGYGFIGIKTLVYIIFMLVIAGKLFGAMYTSAYDGFLPKFQVILVTIIIVAGLDMLGLLLDKCIVGIFNIKTTFSDMIAVTGTKALFETLVILVATVIGIISVPFAIGLWVIFGTLIPFIYYSCFVGIIEANENKKAYVFIVARAVAMIIGAILASVIFSIIAKEISEVVFEMFNFMSMLP